MKLNYKSQPLPLEIYKSKIYSFTHFIQEIFIESELFFRYYAIGRAYKGE
jgi:hypothetical protein